MIDRVLATIEQRKRESLEQLKEFLRIPSVSTKPDHKEHMIRCANWLADQFKFAMLDAKVMPTRGHPVARRRCENSCSMPVWFPTGSPDRKSVV